MVITELPNGFTIEKLSFGKRLWKPLKRILEFAIFLIPAAALLSRDFWTSMIVFGIIAGWHFLELLSFLRFRLKSISFLKDIVVVEYYDHNKLHKIISSYNDLSISHAVIWYKTMNKYDHLAFKWKGEMVFRQFCFWEINEAFLQRVLNKFHAARSEANSKQDV